MGKVRFLVCKDWPGAGHPLRRSIVQIGAFRPLSFPRDKGKMVGLSEAHLSWSWSRLWSCPPLWLWCPPPDLWLWSPPPDLWLWSASCPDLWSPRPP